MKFSIVFALLLSVSAFAAKKPHVEKMDFILDLSASQSTYLATGEADALKLKLYDGTGKLSAGASGVFQWYFPEVSLDISDSLKTLPDLSEVLITLTKKGERTYLKTETHTKGETETNLLEVRFLEGNWQAYENGDEVALVLTDASKAIAQELRQADYRKIVAELQTQFQKTLNDALTAKGLTKAGQELFTVGKMEVDYASATGTSVYRGTNLRIVEKVPPQLFRAHFQLEMTLENASALLLVAAIFAE